MAEWGWCGFGASRGLVPELRLGIVRLACCRGSIVDRVRCWGKALDEAQRVMRSRRSVPAFSAESGQ